MHAEVLIGKNVIALSDNKTAKWPVAVTNRKLAATGIGYLCKRTDSNFNNSHSPYSRRMSGSTPNCHRTIGRAMYYTRVTIILGFSILALSQFIPTIYFGLLTGTTMLVALLADMTLLPVLIVSFRAWDTD